MSKYPEELDVVTPEVEAELRAKHGAGPMKALKTVAGVFVLKRVSREVYRQYREMQSGPKTALGAHDFLARAACVFPNEATVHQRLRDYPALPVNIVNAANQLAGFEPDEDIEGKDLG